jgi:hypothetical protein
MLTGAAAPVGRLPLQTALSLPTGFRQAIAGVNQRLSKAGADKNAWPKMRSQKSVAKNPL